MTLLNFEFKAKISNIDAAEKKLQGLQPVFRGEDHQTDTYFKVPQGRLKLREGHIENALIYYEREDRFGAKSSQVLLYEHPPDPALKAILTKANGIKAVVDKKRRIYCIGNVKFHFDTVKGLGSFIEVEAIDKDGSIGLQTLQQQCRSYADFFSVGENDFIDCSYSDLIMRKAADQHQNQL